MQILSFLNNMANKMIIDTTESITHLNIDLDLIANNKVTVSVILDELTGDIIEATGNGRLIN